MGGFFVIGSRISRKNISGNSFLLIGKNRFQGIKIHNPANSVASIDNRPRTQDNLGLIYSKGINGNNILDITASKNCIIHTYPIYGNEQPVGRKSPNHRTSASQLAFLYKDLSCAL